MCSQTKKHNRYGKVFENIKIEKIEPEGNELNKTSVSR